MQGQYDVIVVGVGAMGAAACRHLAARGARVLGLEQFDIPHVLGSSHGETRVFRVCYYEHADYVPLLVRAGELWRQLEAETGHTLLQTTGLLYAGRGDGPIVSGTARAADLHGIPLERLDGSALRRRFDQFRLPDDAVGVFEPGAGVLRPEAGIVAHAERALRAGAVIHGREAVRDWTADGAGVRVRTDRGTYEADRLVFCAGAWTGPLLSPVGVELTVSRQVIGWVWPRRPERFGPDDFPIWAIEDDDGYMHYGFPLMDGGLGLKVGHHRPGITTTADDVDRGVRPGDEETFRPILARHLPDADGPLLSLRACVYTNTPDGHFVLDRHPEHERVVFAGGFSGHGYKFAPIVGQALSDLALDGRTDLPIGFLGLTRFGA